MLYGILHDQVTARICVEYFTIGHVDLFPPHDPTWLALGWGILATWWAGLLLGLPMGLIAAVGTSPPLTTREVLRPVLAFMLARSALALTAGVVGYILASADVLSLQEPFASAVPSSRHSAFLADQWAHTASYFTGTLGAVCAWIWAWRRRRWPGLASGPVVEHRPRVAEVTETAVVTLLPAVGVIALMAVIAGIAILSAVSGL